MASDQVRIEQMLAHQPSDEIKKRSEARAQTEQHASDKYASHYRSVYVSRVYSHID